MATIEGTELDDILNGTVNDDLIYGLKGNDTLVGGAGNDHLEGGTGYDILDGGSGVDIADYGDSDSGVTASLASPTDNTGDAYGDTYISIEDLGGSGACDTLIGDDGPNKLYGGRGSDILEGGAGNDILEGNAGDDGMIGGQGDDIYFIDQIGDYVIEQFNQGIDTVYTSELFHKLAPAVENLTYIPTTKSSMFSRDFTGIGNTLDNLITSVHGNDILNGGDGNDALDSGDGDDVLIGGTGNDTLIAGYGVDFLIGGDGNDLLIGGGGGDYLIGGAGFDTASYADSGIGVNLNLKTGVYTGGAAGDTVIGIEAFIGSHHGDTFVGNGTTFTFNGGAGYDYVDYSTSTAAVNVDLANSNTTLASGGDAEGNSLVNIEGVFGSAFGDILAATNGTLQCLSGGAGNDIYIDNSHQTNIIEELNGGDDEIRTARNSYSIETVFFVERLTFTGTGNATLTGNFGDNLMTGGSGDDWLDGAKGNDTLIGGQGNDVYIVDSLTDGIIESANAGNDTVITGLSAYTLIANVENLTYTGTSAFTGTGNALDNSLSGGAGRDTLNGGAGNDTLDGGAGDDTLAGGIGNDIYIVDSLGDLVTENPNEGTDTIRTSLSAFTLGANFENLTYTGTVAFSGIGNVLNNSISGGTGNDRLIGGAGNDILNGGAGNDGLDGGIGNDTMIGGLGNDSYYVDSVSDVITENANEGYDSVRANSSAYTLSDNLEWLAYTGTSSFTGTGNALSNTIYGANGNDILDGGAGNDALMSAAGNDTLFGGAGNDGLDGGTGNDTLIGGVGDDSYYVDSVSDVITESVNEGYDSVRANSSAYTLSDNLEWLAYTGTSSFTGTGNALNNTIFGGNGNDILDGGAGNDYLQGNAGNDTLIGGAGNDGFEGGTGNDTMIGGVGDDSYYVDSVSDVITENANEGYDSVRANSSAYTLSDNLEWLAYTGTGNFTGTGNALDNTIFGGNGNDILDGGAGNDYLQGNAGNDTLIGGAGNDGFDGGTGNDTMIGGLGNDSYYVDSVSDVITENANEGYDSVRATSSAYTLGDNLEWLAYTGTSSFTGTGNALDNTIYGGNGNDILDGGAGNDNLQGNAGNDTLIGGAGNDWFEAGAGNDILRGGVGSDTLFGRAGNDRFIFESGLGIDYVADFSAIDDTFAFDRASFGIAATASITDYVRIGGASIPSSPDAAHGYFLVTSNGIYWDSDGTGSQAAVLLAINGMSTAVTIDDFMFV